MSAFHPASRRAPFEARRFSGASRETGGQGMDQGKDQGFALLRGTRSNRFIICRRIFSVRATPAANFTPLCIQQRIENDDFTSRVSGRR